jgi:hypothetical protein
MRIFLYVFLAVSFSTKIFASAPEPVNSFASLPIHFRESRFKEIEEAFEQRATLFLTGKRCHAWQMKKSDKEIATEFDHINEWRFNTWYVDPSSTTLVARDDFMIAQDLLEKGYFLQPQTIAFNYNKTDATYNSSSIVLNGIKFLAMEGPSRKTLPNFFNLLINHQVNQLVRLCPAEEPGFNKMYPYWYGKIKKEAKTHNVYLQIPQGPLNSKPYPILYYAMENWSPGQNPSVKELLNLIQNVKSEFDPASGLLACHCTNGDGRTGTFIAAFVLITEIDKQVAAGRAKTALNFSIEKIVMQLSLQRPYMVLTKEQYLLLYRLVDFYVSGLLK